MTKMIGFKCKSCGHVFFPARSRCLSCRGGEFEKVELGDRCRLVTFTELYALPRGVDRVPLLLGVVEFDSGVKALGQIDTRNAAGLEIGTPLRPVWGPLRRVGREVVFGFRFEPAEAAE